MYKIILSLFAFLACFCLIILFSLFGLFGLFGLINLGIIKNILKSIRMLSLRLFKGYRILLTSFIGNKIFYDKLCYLDLVYLNISFINLKKIKINKFSIVNELRECWEVLNDPYPYGGNWPFETVQEKLGTLEILNEKLEDKKGKKSKKLSPSDIRKTLNLPKNLSNKEVKDIEEFIKEWGEKIKKFIVILKNWISSILFLRYYYLNCYIINCFIMRLTKNIYKSLLIFQLTSISLCVTPITILDSQFITNELENNKDILDQQIYKENCLYTNFKCVNIPSKPIEELDHLLKSYDPNKIYEGFVYWDTKNLKPYILDSNNYAYSRSQSELGILSSSLELKNLGLSVTNMYSNSELSLEKLTINDIKLPYLCNNSLVETNNLELTNLRVNPGDITYHIPSIPNTSSLNTSSHLNLLLTPISENLRRNLEMDFILNGYHNNSLFINSSKSNLDINMEYLESYKSFIPFILILSNKQKLTPFLSLFIIEKLNKIYKNIQLFIYKLYKNIRFFIYKLDMNKLYYINNIKQIINYYRILLIFIIFIFNLIIEIFFLFTPQVMLSVLTNITIVDSFILTNGDIFSNNSSVDGINITVENSIIITEIDNSSSNNDLNNDLNGELINNTEINSEIDTNNISDSETLVGSDNESETDNETDNDSLVGTELEEFDTDEENDIELIRQIEEEEGDYNYNNLENNQLLIGFLITSSNKIKKTLKKINIINILNVLKLLIPIILKLIIFKLITLLFLYYLVQPIYENFYICMNLPLLSKLVKGKNKSDQHFKSEEDKVYPKQDFDFKEEKEKALDKYDEAKFLRFIFKNKQFNIDTDKFSDEELLEKAYKLGLKDNINKNDDNEQNEDNYSSDSQSLENFSIGSQSLENERQSFLKYLNKENIIYTQRNLNNITENLTKDLTDEMKYKSSSINESSSFLLDLSNLIKDSVINIYNKINSPILNNNDNINNTLNNKLEEYYKWASNFKNNLGINFENSVNNQILKDKSIWFNSLTNLSNISNNSIETIRSNWSQNKSNISFGEILDNSLEKPTFTEDGNINSEIFKYLLPIITLKIKRNKNIPFFFTNHNLNSLTFKVKLLRKFNFIKSKIFKLLKRLILTIVIRYLFKWFLIPFFNLFIFDFTILLSVLPIKSIDGNLDSDLYNRRKLTFEERLNRRENKPYQIFKNECEDSPEVPREPNFPNRKSLGRLSEYTELNSINENTKTSQRLINAYNDDYDKAYQEEQDRIRLEYLRCNNYSLYSKESTYKSNIDLNLRIKYFLIDTKDFIIDTKNKFINKFKKINYDDQDQLLENRFWSNDNNKSEWFNFKNIRSVKTFDSVTPYETVKLNKENPLDKYNIRGDINNLSLTQKFVIKLKNKFINNNIKPTDSKWFD